MYQLKNKFGMKILKIISLLLTKIFVQVRTVSNCCGQINHKTNSRLPYESHHQHMKCTVAYLNCPMLKTLKTNCNYLRWSYKYDVNLGSET